MRTGRELVPQSEVRLARGKRAAIGAATACVVALPILLSMIPLASLLYLGGFVVACATLAAAPRRSQEPDICVDEIADPRLRLTYAAILDARDELELVIANAPAYASATHSLQEHCRDAVRLCARIAPVANRLHAYLGRQEMWMLAREATELRERARATTDPTAARALVHAAAAYERQIASCDDLAHTRDRIQARLELVLASLRSFTVAVIKQQTAEDEQLALAGESVAEHVDVVREDLSVLESALELDAAA